MPLVHDHLKGMERKERSGAWPWILAFSGFFAILLLIAGFIQLGVRSSAQQATTPTQQMNAQWLQQAQMEHRAGAFSSAVVSLQYIDATQPMELMDKHTYLGLMAESLTGSGNPAGGAKYYDRYLSMAVNLHKPECRSCHAPPASMAPTKLADLTESARGMEYAAALTAAGSIKTVRKKLTASLKKKPKDARAHLLLYQIETALKNEAQARKHAAALAALDRAARTAAAK